MYCGRCGTKIPDGYQYCMKCGYDNLSFKNHNKKTTSKSLHSNLKIFVFCFFLTILIVLSIISMFESKRQNDWLLGDIKRGCTKEEIKNSDFNDSIVKKEDDTWVSKITNFEGFAGCNGFAKYYFDGDKLEGVLVTIKESDASIYSISQIKKNIIKKYTIKYGEPEKNLNRCMWEMSKGDIEIYELDNTLRISLD
ncbi:MAG: zinc ribbon domain-containing protein [Lachnospiraceae bacterium]|nr:zinc ribbon domain-containing protein [Lachnospiraceae bacterium]